MLLSFVAILKQDDDGEYSYYEGEFDESLNEGELSASYDTDGYDYDYDYGYDESSAYEETDTENDGSINLVGAGANGDDQIIVVALANYKPSDDTELVGVQAVLCVCVLVVAISCKAVLKGWLALDLR